MSRAEVTGPDLQAYVADLVFLKQTKMLLFFKHINVILISRRRGDLALEEAEPALDHRQADRADLDCHADRARSLSSDRGSLKQRELTVY